MKEYNENQQKYNTVGTGPMRKTKKLQHCRNRSNVYRCTQLISRVKIIYLHTNEWREDIQ
jgi:predicted GTPase